MTARRAKLVIRKHKLPEYLGAEETTINQLRDLGLLTFFSLTPGGRAQVVTEDEVAALQEAALEAGDLEALIVRAKQERGDSSSKQTRVGRR